MTPTIAKKLVLSFLGLTLVVLIATLGLARWSFERGFMDYANALEQVRLQSLAVNLSREYVAAGNDWSALSEQQFERLLRSSAPEHMVPARGGGHPPPRGGDRPGPGGERSVLGGHGEQRPPRGESGRPPPGPPMVAPPIALFDLAGRQIAGRPLGTAATDAISVPVTVAAIRVGELRGAPRRRFDSPQETAFARQQLTTSGLIAAVSLALAIVVSLLITRVLLAPIRRMFGGISELANGNFGHRLNESRRDELGQLMGELDLLACKLEENRESRQRWLADISHELRTPVTVLTGEIEILKDGIRPLDMQQVHSLDQEVARLRHLIDDLYDLSVSDIGGLRYVFGPVDSFERVTAAVESVQGEAAKRGIEISLRGEAAGAVNADAQRLDQLFLNLFKNALAYTDAPGRIEIAVSVNAGRVAVVIDDTAPGIDAEECERLFEPLYRPDSSRSRRRAGAGLGLAICRNIVTAHRGTITAAPSALGGLTIRIELPERSES